MRSNNLKHIRPISFYAFNNRFSCCWCCAVKIQNVAEQNALIFLFICDHPMQPGNKLSESMKSFYVVVVKYPFEKLFKYFFKFAFAL